MKRIIGWVLPTLCLLGCGVAAPSQWLFYDVAPISPLLDTDTIFRFQATDSRGVPQAGVPVTFALEKPDDSVTLVHAGQTDASGLARTILRGHGRVSSVVVLATAGGKVAKSGAVTFAGTTPSSRWLTFQCGPLAGLSSGGIHAIGAFDESRTLIAGVKLDCAAHVADRNGDGLEGHSVSFLVEAGTVGRSNTSVSDVIGNADILYKSSLPLPKETDPATFSWNPTKDPSHTGDYLVPLWMHPYEWTPNPYKPDPSAKLQEPRRTDPIRVASNGGPVTNNPRDNLVTMIAYTTGEEGYDDVNNNGVFDKNEKYDDLPEPFVDANDNGTYDEGELYIDVNGNGHWDAANGIHDDNTTIWTSNKILWTGIPAGQDMLDPSVPTVKALPFTAPGIDQLKEFNSTSGNFNVADPWWNTMARNSNTDGCISASESTVVKVASSTQLGVRFTYPPFETVNFIVNDVRDPNANPSPPPYAFPESFIINLGCRYTASPNAGQVYELALPSVNGVFLN